MSTHSLYRLPYETIFAKLNDSGNIALDCVDYKVSSHEELKFFKLLGYEELKFFNLLGYEELKFFNLLGYTVALAFYIHCDLVILSGP